MSYAVDPERENGLRPAIRHLYPGPFHGSTFVADAEVSQRTDDDSAGVFRRVC
ncbi:hypothetical protein QRX50_19310 [Amycolatopsis carbonis]|uniref:Uncharacterized protein n=1 Tax=Amycolatopsis carbonis TaxID=715471 RepID=A0A9Y2IP15_9PSEU|nr:hypothetical protein [Amycolatopsis sp. 2-15]WIX82771.1 hypothetical protein QRX50_19310 [Amycolatopsis sp. 2-15]